MLKVAYCSCVYQARISSWVADAPSAGAWVDGSATFTGSTWPFAFGASAGASLGCEDEADDPAAASDTTNSSCECDEVRDTVGVVRGAGATGKTLRIFKSSSMHLDRVPLTPSSALSRSSIASLVNRSIIASCSSVRMGGNCVIGVGACGGRRTGCRLGLGSCCIKWWGWAPCRAPADIRP
jgi:hypothetical protein